MQNSDRRVSACTFPKSEISRPQSKILRGPLSVHFTIVTAYEMKNIRIFNDRKMIRDRYKTSVYFTIV